MGYTYRVAIEKAAFHVLERLRHQTDIPYSTFYDGTDETHDELERILDWDCPEHAIDLAVAQLEQQGLVETEPRSNTLSDGELDYSIRLLRRGHEWLGEPFDLSFYDAE